MVPLSVLDLSPICVGSTPGDALRNSLSLAQHAENLGYQRYWVAEHHNMRGIASAATSVVIGHIAGGTRRIRVGAGGIMLPNHAPLVIAEQFGTLDALYPGRIDLGLGRAPGTDQLTSRALRRTLAGSVDSFPQDVLELQAYLGEPQEGQRVLATPGANSDVPLWVLGSSLYGASLAAALGLPYAFASHFAPQMMDQAIALYRESFKPSAQLDKPYVMLGYNIVAADTEKEAQYLRSSGEQAMLNLRRGMPGPLPAPIENFRDTLGDMELRMLDDVSRCAAVGSQAQVQAQLDEFVASTGADEVMVVAQIYDHNARLKSYELAASAMAAAA